MPWRQVGVVEERLAFVLAAEAGEDAMSALCARHGISRDTGYKWRRRYRAEGVAGLLDRPRAPHAHGRATPEALAEAIVSLKEAHPTWGPRKLVARLQRLHPDLTWPSHSTAGEILKRAGLVAPRKRRRRAAASEGPLVVPDAPNRLWAVDHKGWVRLGDKSRCEPLTITDGFSRYLIGLWGLAGTAEALAKPLFERAFCEYGLPDAIRSDNGAPFASTGVTGLTQLSAWWLKLGIEVERIAPGKPQQNGRHERMHATLHRETMASAASDAAAQQARFDVFRRVYNDERPHEALGQTTPSEHYRPSARPYPARPPEPDYPPEAAERRVRSTGEIKWRGELVHLSRALCGETVAVQESESGLFEVYFYKARLGVLGPSGKLVRPSALDPRGALRRAPQGSAPRAPLPPEPVTADPETPNLSAMHPG